MFWKIYSGIITVIAIITTGLFVHVRAVQREEDKLPLYMVALHRTMRKDGMML